MKGARDAMTEVSSVREEGREGGKKERKVNDGGKMEGEWRDKMKNGIDVRKSKKDLERQRQ